MSPFILISQVDPGPASKMPSQKKNTKKRGTETRTSDRTIARWISYRSPEEVTFEHVVIGVLAPVMLKVHRHAESEVDSNTVASPMAQGGYS